MKIEQTEVDKQIERAQQWYAEHGWITLAFDRTLHKGARVNLVFDPNDEFSKALAGVVNLVISDIATDSQRKQYETFTFVCASPMNPASGYGRNGVAAITWGRRYE